MAKPTSVPVPQHLAGLREGQRVTANKSRLAPPGSSVKAGGVEYAVPEEAPDTTKE